LHALFIRETRLHEKRLWKKGYEFIFTPFPKKKIFFFFSVAAAASDEKLGRGVGDKIEFSNQAVVRRLDSDVSWSRFVTNVCTDRDELALVAASAAGAVSL
jgi:hypothetical protein